MRHLTTFIFLCLVFASTSQAATWVKLHETSDSKLMLDKQSVLQKDQLKRAWIKVEFKTPQKNAQFPDKEYNLSKLLWFFDCPSQKSATTQVFQYLNNELVYSAAIESKTAEFIEPVPDTDVDMAMHYVCSSDKTTGQAATRAPDTKSAKVEAIIETKPATPIVNSAKTGVTAKVEMPAVETPVAKPTASETVKVATKKIAWSYQGKTGPDYWATLNPSYTNCATGQNQSPININQTVHAFLKPIRGIFKFQAKDISNNGRLLQVNFKEGNMLAVDNNAFQLKQLNFHAPSTHTIKDRSFPLEGQFVLADNKGNLSILAVMFQTGKTNFGLAKIVMQLPIEADGAVTLKNRLIPNDLMPENHSYYRYSGSLTTPPCSEGVRWIVMKTPLSASPEQIAAFVNTLQHNNRPLQPLNGRMVVE
jgi:carbonic anhydrase